jgi:solute carrier family 8 (sodium/calcium exchanger)
LVPPAGIWGGWLSFFVSLGVIGLLTAIVGDLAGIFGCLIGLDDAVTGNLPIHKTKEILLRLV